MVRPGHELVDGVVIRTSSLAGAFIKKVLFTNPSTRAGYDTGSIFKRSLTGFNSEFSFS